MMFFKKKISNKCKFTYKGARFDLCSVGCKKGCKKFSKSRLIDTMSVVYLDEKLAQHFKKIGNKIGCDFKSISSQSMMNMGSSSSISCYSDFLHYSL